MSLKIDDIVEVVITKWNEYGLHNVRIIGSDYYEGILLPIRHKTQNGSFWTGIYYKGLKVTACVTKINNQFVDLIEVREPFGLDLIQQKYQDKNINT